MLMPAQVRKLCGELCSSSISFFVIFFLLGIGRNLPGEFLYFYGVGLPEFFVLLAFMGLMISRVSRTLFFKEAWLLRDVLFAGLGFVFFALISMGVNMERYGGELHDFFEIIRYGCYLGLVVFSAYAVRQFGTMPIVAFVLGVLLTALVAWLCPKNPNLNGLNIRVIFNPNVIGNILAVAAVMGSIIILWGRASIGMALACVAAIFSFYTFSKGTWIMMTFGIGSCFLALVAGNNTGGKSERRLAYFIFAIFILVIILFHQMIAQVVEAKIVATQFGATPAEGGSVAARWGLIVSAYHMFLMDPFFGVGVSNFEDINHLIQQQLGILYYVDNNPNNAWLYILGCMGLSAFLCFLWSFFVCARLFFRAPVPLRLVRAAYALCAMLVLFVGGNVQLEMLTGLYFWVLLGFLAGGTIPQLTSYPSFLNKS